MFHLKHVWSIYKYNFQTHCVVSESYIWQVWEMFQTRWRPFRWQIFSVRAKCMEAKTPFSAITRRIMNDCCHFALITFAGLGISDWEFALQGVTRHKCLITISPSFSFVENSFVIYGLKRVQTKYFQCTCSQPRQLTNLILVVKREKINQTLQLYQIFCFKDFMILSVCMIFPLSPSYMYS